MKPLNDFSLLLVDDHALFRAGLRLILAEGLPFAPRMEEAGSLTDALAVPGEVQLVLLDIQMPGVNGVQGVALLRRRWPQAAIVMLSAQEDRALIQEALRRGAAAFLSKSAPPASIVAAVMAVARGHPPQGDVALEESGPLAAAPAQGAAGHDLSARQLDVLLLMCEGISNKAIARKLFVSENTVRSHVAAVLKFFGSSTRVEAVMAAQKSGMVSLRSAALNAVIV